MPKGYYRATEAMPEQLAARAFAHLKTPQKVTFAHSLRPFNGSEDRLPADLVLEIRAALDESKMLTCRTIYFGPEMITRRLQNAKAAAIFLAAEKNMPLMVIADAIGVAEWTIRRWGIKACPPIWSPDELPEKTKKKYHDAGYACCVTRGTAEQRSLYGNHYTLVGACLKRLEKRQAEEDAKPPVETETSFVAPAAKKRKAKSDGTKFW